MRCLFALLFSLLVLTVNASESPPLDTGEVTVPLTTYTNLLTQSQTQPRPAPAAYTLGTAQISVTVKTVAKHTQANVNIKLDVQVLEDEWTIVPLLSAPVALQSAKINGRAVQLLNNRDGLHWVSQEAGTYQLELYYQVDAQTHDDGIVVPLVLPASSATTLQATLPGTGLAATVLPAVGIETQESGNQTMLHATLTSQQGAQLSWRPPLPEGYALTRASYEGELRNDALHWTMTLQVQLFQDAALKLPLLPSHVTLTELHIDGQAATVLVEDQQFVTLLQGMGKHDIKLWLQIPVTRSSGPPNATLPIPPVPVSQVSLTLPGKKNLSMTPTPLHSTSKGKHSASSSTPNQVSVTLEQQDKHTVASAYLPLSHSVTFSWSEAIPAEVLVAELRAHASLYHLVHAEEGVLHGTAVVDYDITRGETKVLQLTLPNNVQINRITGKAVSDWRVSPIEKDPHQSLSVFLDRQIKGSLRLNIDYEQLLGDNSDAIPVPFLQAVNVQRQRGMVALLSGAELTLKPTKTEHLSKVGENQLPAYVRQDIKHKIAHTYKYTSNTPLLIAQASAPERQRGKFDARVDTLLSIGDVTLKGSATVEINVKTGSLMDLDLLLPPDVNVLGLTAPSLRTYRVKPDDKGQLIAVEFTQEMEGQFRLELNYEQILSEGQAETLVPTATVIAAEVEHGRIAVEALAAVEVQASTTEQLSSLDLNELPQQLVLKTTNPILLAYRYVHIDPPYKLGLTITRHKEIDVQVASIEQARYQTLLTRDGLAVTTAQYTIRNSRKQFLRLQLPKDAQVWSVFVNGNSEKPAQANDDQHVLIKMMNSTNGFNLDLVYAVQLPKISHQGRINMRLPRPDIVVTNTRWDVFVPHGLRYHKPETNMDVLHGHTVVQAEQIQARLQASNNLQQQQALRVNVPTQGTHFAFAKLYANQSEEDAQIHLPYVSPKMLYWADWLAVLGAGLIAVTVLALAVPSLSIPMLTALLCLIGGLALVLYVLVGLGTGLFAVLITWLLAALGIGGFAGYRWRFG